MEGIPFKISVPQRYYDDVGLRSQIVGNRRYSSPMFTQAKDKVCKNLTARLPVCHLFKSFRCEIVFIAMQVIPY